MNGAQLFYAGQFGIGGDEYRSTWLVGLVNSAPYVCCAFFGCWMTTPFNSWFGRRGTIFVTCLISALACFWQGFVGVSFRVDGFLGLILTVIDVVAYVSCSLCTRVRNWAQVCDWYVILSYNLHLGAETCHQETTLRVHHS